MLSWQQFMQQVFTFYEPMPPRPRNPERLFLALLPDGEAARDIERVRQRFFLENGLDWKPLAVERYHLSLIHLGDFSRLKTKYLYAACLAADVVSMAPFEVCLHGIESFESGRPYKRPLVLLGKGDGLVKLHKALGDALRKVGFRVGENFKPHVTLSYGPRHFPLQSIEPISFTADEFRLIHSERPFTRYHVLERWALRN